MKIKVPHEYLPVLRALRNDASCDAVSTDEVLDALIAAAEADQPPYVHGALYRVVEHSVTLYGEWDETLQGFVGQRNAKGEAKTWAVGREVTSATLVRPIVTEADVEKAAMLIYDDDRAEDGWPGWVTEAVKTRCRKIARAAFKAAEIEVTP